MRRRLIRDQNGETSPAPSHSNPDSGYYNAAPQTGKLVVIRAVMGPA